ncbi:MAG: hypothetical protein MUO21_05185 [Nitrososphaeraceae archaeon]|nr:hypothetical protein [Nitrososphaeraceae archaeon]
MELPKSLVGTSIDNLRNLQKNHTQPQINPHEYKEYREQYENTEVPKSTSKAIEDFDIDELTKDINDNMQDDTFASVSETEEDKSSYIPFGWKEPLLLLLVYLFLSQSLIRQFAGKYIPQLNPGEDGTVGFVGVLIYGILLVTVYFIVKKLLI